MACGLIALAVGVLCVAVAAKRWHRLTRAGQTLRPGRVCVAQLATSGRALELAAALLGDAEAEKHLSAVLDAPSRAHALAELNELTTDLAWALGAHAAVARSAARVALSTGTLLALVELARTLPQGLVSVGWALGAFASGLSSALAARLMGRLADSRARELREAWNALARTLPPPLGERGQDGPALVPQTRRLSHRRSR